MGRKRGAGRSGRAGRKGAAPRAWAAVAAARRWIATAYSLASWGSRRDGCRAMAKAATAGRDAAAAGAEAVARDGRMNGEARNRAAAALRRAVRVQRQARAAFKNAAMHARSSASVGERAADAYAMAGDADNERELREEVAGAQKMAAAADKWAGVAGMDARTTRVASRKWQAPEGGAPGQGGGAGEWRADRAAWVDGQSRIHADAEYTRASWEDAAKMADAAVRAAGDDMQRYAAATADAAEAVDRMGRMPPEADAAMAAWEEIMDHAAQIHDECSPHARSGGGSR